MERMNSSGQSKALLPKSVNTVSARAFPPPSPPIPSTMTKATPGKLCVFCAALLMLLPVAAAKNPKVLPKPPRVIWATNTTLTLEADVLCPPNCNVSQFITWEIKSGLVPDNQILFKNETTAIEIGGLSPGVRYDIRALLQMEGESTAYNGDDVPVLTAYTCHEFAPGVINLTAEEIGTSHFVIKWAPSKESCVSVNYLIQTSIYEDHIQKLQCPPSDSARRDSRYLCNETQDGQECTALIDDDVKSGWTYRVTVIPVWGSQCSSAHFVLLTTKSNELMSIGSVAVLILGLSLAWAAMYWTIIYYRKRRAVIAAIEFKMGFSRELPRAANGRVYDDDGYLIPLAELELLYYDRM